MNLFFRKIINWSTLCAPFFIWLLPVDFFDKGQTTCVFTNLSGYNCYACGLTRAVMHVMHLEFVEAWNFNKLVFIVLPALSVFWFKALYEVQGKSMPGILGKLTSPNR